MIELNLLVGIVGMFCILIAFIMDEFYKKWNQETIRYNLTNLIGAGLLIYYAYTLVSWPFMFLNAVWFIVAGYKLIKVS